jgi:D-alanyl-D-alanine carboxypeptidase/D-alanyl-D-alanine-endopeptidase (penicillin-binding protein 4)
MKATHSYLFYFKSKETIANSLIKKLSELQNKNFSFLKVLGPLLLFTSCAVSQQISNQAKKDLLNNSAISTGHIGISIYEPATDKYWFNLDAEKYFVPASNTKLFSLYAGMKYLGDSLVGLKYEKINDHLTAIAGTGDPTFLHPDFKNQPVLNFLNKEVDYSYVQNSSRTNLTPLGNGWAWDDYQSDYSAERSEMPIYSNLVKFYLQNDTLAVSPSFFYNPAIQSLNKSLANQKALKFSIQRPFENNLFQVEYLTDAKFSEQLIPFKTSSSDAASNSLFFKLLEDTLHKKINAFDLPNSTTNLKNIIHSRPTDSLFRPMMHRSDNFFAEQTLLMVSNELLGVMNDEKIIVTLLKIDLADIPQRPKWVDGSGLSRYNLFTPMDFIYILIKLKNEFGFDRLKNILPTGGQGTLANYYLKDAGFIFAKTGGMSNHCSISGILLTKKNKFLLFSVLSNQYSTGSTPVRRAVEKFLSEIRDKN